MSVSKLYAMIGGAMLFAALVRLVRQETALQAPVFWV